MKKFGLFTLLTFIFSVSFIKAAYIDEYPEAYKWAYKNGITTQKTIEKADMEGQITRIALSKMISNYATNVLNKKVDTSKKCQFSDISDKLNSDYDNGATKACQLGLMGQGITKFRPYDKVTRAEFATILSRLLRGNEYDGGTPYYQKHTNKLNIMGIMTNIKNPEKVNESRGNVMVMLKRSEEKGNINIPSFNELEQETSITCIYEDYLGYESETNLTKQYFILPYKDGYFGFSYGGQDGWGFTIEYRKLQNPCSVFISSDEIFSWNPHYEIGESEEFGDNYLFLSKNEEKYKELDCKAGEHNKCLKEAKKYIYNLLVGTETNEYFSFRIYTLKKRIINNDVNVDRLTRYYDCYDKYINKYNVDNSGSRINITDEEKQIKEQYLCKSEKIRNCCTYEYIDSNLSGKFCKNLGTEINNCNNITVKTEPIKDEKFPGYNVIYGGEGYHNIIGEKTVYYDDKIGFSFKLGKQFDGGIIHDEYRKLSKWPEHSIYFYKKCPNCWDEALGKEGYDLSFTVQIFDKDDPTYDPNYDSNEILTGKNNKYYFMGTKNIKFVADFNIFNVKE